MIAPAALDRLAAAVTAVTAQVREECRSPANAFTPAFWAEHVQLVTDRALALAPGLGADPGVLRLAAPLHDLAAVRDLAAVPEHAREGGRLAREILAGHGLPPDRIEAVAAAIEAHSWPVTPGQGTPEQVALSNADVLSHLARPAYWCFYLFGVRRLDHAQGLAWLRTRAGAAWEALTPAARALGAADHAAFQLVCRGDAPAP